MSPRHDSVTFILQIGSKVGHDAPLGFHQTTKERYHDLPNGFYLTRLVARKDRRARAEHYARAGRQVIIEGDSKLALFKPMHTPQSEYKHRTNSDPHTHYRSG